MEEPRFFRVQYGFQYSTVVHFRKKQAKAHSAKVSEARTSPQFFRFFSDYGHSALAVTGLDSMIVLWNVEAAPFPISTLQLPSHNFTTYDYQLENKIILGQGTGHGLEMYKLDEYLDDFIHIPLETPRREGFSWGQVRISKRHAMACGEKEGENAVFYLWDPNTAKIVRELDLGSPNAGVHKYTDATEQLVTGHVDNMKLWDVRIEHPLIHKFERPFEREVVSVGLSRSLIGCGGDRGYKLWDLRKLDQVLEEHNDFIQTYCHAFDLGESFIVAADDQGKVEVLMKKSVHISGEPIRVTLTAPVSYVAGDEKIVVLLDLNSRVHVWDFLQAEYIH
jgi:hypothetical protein